MKPYIGQVVHFYENYNISRKPRAAIVSDVLENGVCNLRVMPWNPDDRIYSWENVPRVTAVFDTDGKWRPELGTSSIFWTENLHSQGSYVYDFTVDAPTHPDEVTVRPAGLHAQSD